MQTSIKAYFNLICFVVGILAWSWFSQNCFVNNFFFIRRKLFYLDKMRDVHMLHVQTMSNRMSL